MTFKAVIMVGLPGSGKSTWIRKNLPGSTIVCSADHHHIRNGVYDYRPEEAPRAHDLCLQKWVDILSFDAEWAPCIAVDNTNLVLAQLSPYYYLARAVSLDLHVIWMDTPVEVCFERNRSSHRVPEETMQMLVVRQTKLFAEWPGGWEFTSVSGVE